MRKLAAAFNQEVTESRQAVYLEALMDLSKEQLEFAFRHCIADCRFFPTVAEIRSVVMKQLEAEDAMNSEKAWDTVKLIFRRHWHPDIGLYGDPPKLDEAAEWALRQIGSFQGIARSDIENESFLRKDFITAYKRYRETGGYLAPTREQAAKLLADLRKELPQ